MLAVTSATGCVNLLLSFVSENFDDLDFWLVLVLVEMAKNFVVRMTQSRQVVGLCFLAREERTVFGVVVRRDSVKLLAVVPPLPLFRDEGVFGFLMQLLQGWRRWKVGGGHGDGPFVLRFLRCLEPMRLGSAAVEWPVKVFLNFRV